MPWYLNLPLAQVDPAAGDVVVQAVEAPAALDPMTKLLLTLAVVVGSFVLGGLVAKWLKMRDYGLRIGMVFFTIAASAAVLATGTPKFGIDLNGGVELIYQIKSSDLAEVTQNITKKLNQNQDVKLEPLLDEKEIEIPIPAGTDAETVKNRVAKDASTELEISSVRFKPDSNDQILVYDIAEHARTMDADKMTKLVTAVKKRLDPNGTKELTIRSHGKDMIEVIVPETGIREVDAIKYKIKTAGVLQFRIAANQQVASHLLAIKAANVSPEDNVYVKGKLVAHWSKLGDAGEPTGGVFRGEGPEKRVLMMIDPYNINGEFLRSASAGRDDKGMPDIQFSFDSTGAKLFRQLTSENVPDSQGVNRFLSILLDDTVKSAPTINEEIGGDGRITGRFTPDQVEQLVAVLNAGHLPASLNETPISDNAISSQLGQETVRDGEISMIVSTGAVLLFMLVYYRFAGIVADFAVTLNMVITLALMVAFKVAFTLPGLAGLVLTVGMAVDANVLIYERIREERARGASLRMGIRNGFTRAWATIIDSHMTTMITGIVLWWIGSDQIKGFAISLVLGLMASLYTSVFVVRIIFDVFEHKGWLTKLTMMHFIGATNINFTRLLKPALSVSLSLIAIGMVAAYSRWAELFDIDFTGGASVHFVLMEPMETNAVRERLEGRDVPAANRLPDIAVSSVGDKQMIIKLDTSETKMDRIKEVLREQFPTLTRYEMTYGDLASVDSLVERPKLSAPAASPETPATTKEPSNETEEPAPENKQSSLRGGRAAGLPWSPQLAAIALAQPAQPKSAPAKGAQPAPKSAAPAAKGPAPVQPKANAPAADTPPAPTADAPASAAPTSETPETPAPDAVSATPKAESTPAAEESAAPGGKIEITRALLKFKQSINHDALKAIINEELANAKSPAHFTLSTPGYTEGNNNEFAEWTLRIEMPQEACRHLLEEAQTRLGQEPVFRSASLIGGKVAGDTKFWALVALLASMAIIVIYVWIRFQNVAFGFGAIMALVHDVAITIGFLAMSAYIARIPFFEHYLLIDPFKISLSVVAALLTIVGYSINDTIVVFDRIREIRGKSTNLTETMINTSVNQTLSRTILTSGTVFISAFFLYVLGGPGIHAFAFAMLIGVITGTFSSIYIASPVLLWLKPSKTAEANQRIGATTSASR